ncbi:MAG: hypothetical protein AB1403_07145 [Candidatus Riflebacteria bacterium]
MARCRILVILIVVLLNCSFAMAATNRIDRFFVFGTNLAWFNNNYGADIGTNHAEGGWSPTFKQDHCEKVFANLAKMGCPVVRIWAFERQEGLKFTADLTSDPDYPYHEVIGLDEKFMENCRYIMDCAARYRVKVYWSLLNHLIREEQGGRHMRIITDAKVRASYLKNAALPFVKEFAVHPAFFAVDIMNEADGAIGGTDFLSGGMNPKLGCTWKQMRVFIKECAKAFHEAVPGVKVTCTSGWHEYKNVKAGRFSGLGLDFYDWHSYRDDPDLPHASELNLDKPVIIGECGPKTQEPDAGYSLQGPNWAKYLNQARKGYAGLLTWSYGNQGQASNFVMVNADHSWRSGAVFMQKAAAGSMIPDAGPLLLNSAEKKVLQYVNKVLKKVVALKEMSRPGFVLNAAQKRLLWLGSETQKYYPYVNPKYAVISLARAIEEITAAGKWELRNPSENSVLRVRELQRIGQSLAQLPIKIKSSRLSSALNELKNFLAIDPENHENSGGSPFESGLIGIED